MKHASKTRKLGREKSQREALIRSLARSLVLHSRVETTEARAKSLRPFIEKLVTKAADDTVSTRRLITRRLSNERKTVDALFERAKGYADRPGGYTRIIKLSPRESDASSRAVIEFV